MTYSERNKEFYNKESSIYSIRRYEGITDTYVKFLFKKRRVIVLDMLSKIIEGKQNLSLLDIACADGVITKAVDDNFPGIFSKFVGTDIAPLMIEVAQKKFFGDKRFSFYIKDKCPKEQSDIVFGMGYLTATIFEDEMIFLNDRLKPRGYYLCTLTSNNSLLAKIKLRNNPVVEGYKTYLEYRTMLMKYFEIIEEIPSGLFIPKLWVIPSIARVVQPILENIFGNIFSNLFQEKTYLLRKKSTENI